MLWYSSRNQYTQRRHCLSCHILSFFKNHIVSIKRRTKVLLCLTAQTQGAPIFDARFLCIKKKKKRGGPVDGRQTLQTYVWKVYQSDTPAADVFNATPLKRWNEHSACDRPAFQLDFKNPTHPPPPRRPGKLQRYDVIWPLDPLDTSFQTRYRGAISKGPLLRGEKGPKTNRTMVDVFERSRRDGSTI